MNRSATQLGSWSSILKPSLTLLSAVATIFAACGGGGGSGGQAAAPPNPQQAVERSAGLAVSTVVSFVATESGVPGTGTGGGATTAVAGRRTHARLRTAALAALADSEPSAHGNADAGCGSCPEGGSACGSCSETNSSTSLQLSFSGCQIFDEADGTLLTANGGLSGTVAATGVCDTGEVPDDVAESVRLSAFSAVVTDPSGQVVERVTGNFTASTTPTGNGCAGANRDESIDGSLDAQLAADGIDASMQFHNLRFNVQSSGVPCVEQILANGGLDVDDRAGGRRLSESLDNLRITLSDATDGGTLVTIDGNVSTSCIGNVVLSTQQPLDIAPGAKCPSGGVLAVQRDDGASGQIQFNADGSLVIHYGDGTPDKTVASCQDASLSQCG